MEMMREVLEMYTETFIRFDSEEELKQYLKKLDENSNYSVLYQNGTEIRVKKEIIAKK
jgi:hypothetical protein